MDTLLDRRIGVVWSRAPLGDALKRLADSQKAAIWLDRRIDPGRRVSQVARDVPLVDVLARVARDQELGICRFHTVVYLGPPEAAARLRTLGELRRREAEELPRAAARRFVREEPIRWDDLATPRELLARLADENGLRIEGLDRVVHDLWPAMALPPLKLVDRLTLVLAPLDLTFQFEDRGDRIRLAAIPDRVALARGYSAHFRPEDAGLPAEEVARRWSRILPEARVTVEGGRIVVEGRLEDHERLRGSKRPTGRRPPRSHDPAERVIDQLRIERVKFADQPLVPIVRQLAAQLKLQLRLDADALRRRGIDPNRRISVELEDVAVDELFRAVLEPAGLTFRREGSTIEVRVAGP